MGKSDWIFMGRSLALDRLLNFDVLYFPTCKVRILILSIYWIVGKIISVKLYMYGTWHAVNSFYFSLTLTWGYVCFRERERKGEPERDRGREREREKQTEKHQCERETFIGLLLHVPWQVSNLQPRSVPWLADKPATFWCTMRCSNQLSHLARASELFINDTNYYQF